MSYASSRYQQQSGSYLSGRQIEALAFEHVNAKLRNPPNPKCRQDALTATIKLWSILLNSLDRTDCPLDPILKNDLSTLGNWCMRYANNALNKIVSLTPLIDIHQDMIDGLKATPPASPAASSTKTAFTASASASHKSLELIG